MDIWTDSDLTTETHSINVSSVDYKMLLRTVSWNQLSLFVILEPLGPLLPLLGLSRTPPQLRSESFLESLSLSSSNLSSIKLIIAVLCISAYLLFSSLKIMKMRMPVNNFKFYFSALYLENKLCRPNFHLMNLKFLLNNIEIPGWWVKILNGEFSSCQPIFFIFNQKSLFSK